MQLKSWNLLLQQGRAPFVFFLSPMFKNTFCLLRFQIKYKIMCSSSFLWSQILISLGLCTLNVNLYRGLCWQAISRTDHSKPHFWLCLCTGERWRDETGNWRKWEEIRGLKNESWRNRCTHEVQKKDSVKLQGENMYHNWYVGSLSSNWFSSSSFFAVTASSILTVVSMFASFQQHRSVRVTFYVMNNSNL